MICAIYLLQLGHHIVLDLTSVIMSKIYIYLLYNWFMINNTLCQHLTRSFSKYEELVWFGFKIQFLKRIFHFKNGKAILLEYVVDEFFSNVVMEWKSENNFLEYSENGQ